jgi:hypothetical protein
VAQAGSVGSTRSRARCLSKDEVQQMSLTGKRAVDLAKALKAVGVTTD